MSIVNASETQLASVVESVPGTTPASPTLQKMRFTGGGMQVVQDFVTSNEISRDRNIKDRARVGRRTEGAYNFELSYGTFDTWLEGLLQGAWTADVLKNGTTKKYFTLEELFEAGATDQYKRLPGCQVNTMSLTIAAGQIVTGSFGFMGNGAPTLAQAALGSATYTDPNDNPVLTASNDFAALTMTGLTSPKIQSINLNVTNNLRQQPVVGSIDAAGIGSGRFDVTGSITMYFENQAAYQQFLSNEYTDLSFTVGGVTEKNYQVLLPKIKFTAASIEAAGNDTDVPLTLEFGAVYDSTEGSALSITRTPEEE